MAEKELSEHRNRKQPRQLVSVPFIWEQRPGFPKKDWKPTAHPPVNPVAPPPVKLVASIPFKWEEKPGKPLPCFSQPTPESGTQLTPANSIGLPWPLVCFQGNDGNGDPSCHNDDDEQKGMFESNLEPCSFETDESSSSAPSLLANRLVSAMAISSAVPWQHTFLTENQSGQPQTPPSPASEADSSTSTYATGTTSLVGASFLECLFPLSSPNSSFLDKVGYSEKISSHIPPKVPNEDFDRESNCSIVIRRPPTLGELIVMSRRRSCRRKAIQMRKQNYSMEFMKKSAFGCCVFRTSNNILGLHKKWKRQLRLNLV
ncbi:uncharacterized protein LOC132270438 [Cornus florida]|uniref:uncharacterized protein LOC132270438 n=1 Tax=Cornus florida TaxID=4283 RepID=UPI00289D38D2|nr:uncharacterized protein LOC132270438 [Cornus florida]